MKPLRPLICCSALSLFLSLSHLVFGEEVISASLHFNLFSYDVEQKGLLRQGESFSLSYTDERLPQCRGTYSGVPAWGILAHAIFQPGGEQPFPQKVSQGQKAIFKIPPKAQFVELWFVNGGRCAQLYYDSQQGKNYRFAIQP